MTGQRDNLYARPRRAAPFVFDEQVARVFDDMIERSVPGYHTSLAIISAFAPQFLTSRSLGYDLGCASGKSTFAMLAGTGHADCRVIAVDNAPPMVDRLAQQIQHTGEQRVSLLCADMRDLQLQPAAMIVIHFTLQFVPPEQRSQLLARCAASLTPSGGMLLFEKITATNAVTTAHHNLKTDNGYSRLEIAQKRRALESVLKTESADTHTARLHACGFNRVTTIFTALNFAGWLAQL